MNIDLSKDKISVDLVNTISSRIFGLEGEIYSKFYSVNDEFKVMEIDDNVFDADIGRICFKIRAPYLAIIDLDEFLFARLNTPGEEPKPQEEKEFMLFVVRIQTQKLLIKGCRDYFCPIFTFDLNALCFPDFSFQPWNAYIFCQLNKGYLSLHFDYYLTSDKNNPDSLITNFLVSPFMIKSILNN